MASPKRQNPHPSKSQSGTGDQTSNTPASSSNSKGPFPLPLKQAQGTENNPANDPPGSVQSCSASKRPATESNATEEGNRPAEVQLPTISFGNTEPQPRWVCVRANTLPIPSRIMALSNPRNSDRMVQPPVLPGSVQPHNSALVNRNPDRMAVLAWRFDAGNSQGWNGLGYDLLYMHAYGVLERTLTDPMARERLRAEIRQGNLARRVLNADDPLPPLPPPPTACPLPGNIRPRYIHNDYNRPTLARHDGVASEPDVSEIVPRMRRHIWRTDGNDSLSPSPTSPERHSREMAPSPENSMQEFSEPVQAPATGKSMCTSFFNSLGVMILQHLSLAGTTRWHNLNNGSAAQKQVKLVDIHNS